ncbi:hypothetical protein QMK19_41010 [Streptomyces sp. H10-C2]|uniref:hypothetical protein n=1 Tax=unclassified Streptomyces TaxID=2593676 RepID=UPI0024BB5214|nr:MULTISPECIES: hypothetical protein [unclassified Streptomyces]MDJ0346807.1 hypothetical protein [Streptomyces sp. PH10-H1]MDJ0375779.1 hypothetical protein [Streptomyces sp. H10-C2]
MNDADGFEVWVVRSAFLKTQLTWLAWSSQSELGQRVRRILKKGLKPAVGTHLREQMLPSKFGSLDPRDWLPAGRYGERDIVIDGLAFTIDLSVASGGILAVVTQVRTVQ